MTPVDEKVKDDDEDEDEDADEDEDNDLDTDDWPDTKLVKNAPEIDEQ